MDAGRVEFLRGRSPLPDVVAIEGLRCSRLYRGVMVWHRIFLAADGSWVVGPAPKLRGACTARQWRRFRRVAFREAA